jgi:aryl-alcohol dehydrogenase-like predicted oxidoreductase
VLGFFARGRVARCQRRRGEKQSATLDTVARRLGSTSSAVAIAWLLHQAPNMVVIPGTSKVAHLRENLAAADLALPEDALAELAGIAVESVSAGR